MSRSGDQAPDRAPDADLIAALEALRSVARRSVVARGLQGPVEQRLLQSIVDATVSLFDAEASSIATNSEAIVSDILSTPMGLQRPTVN